MAACKPTTAVITATAITRRWTNNWHNDRRYDWNRYRNQHRSIFRLGVYYDPFGYGYRRWSIGFILWPSYYGSSYLAQRSVAVSPAAGLWPVPLGPLL